MMTPEDAARIAAEMVQLRGGSLMSHNTTDMETLRDKLLDAYARGVRDGARPDRPTGLITTHVEPDGTIVHHCS